MERPSLSPREALELVAAERLAGQRALEVEKARASRAGEERTRLEKLAARAAPFNRAAASRYRS